MLPDEQGTVCPDLEFAVREACSGAREILAEAIRHNQQIVADAMLLADEEGRTLETVPLSALLPARTKGHAALTLRELPSIVLAPQSGRRWRCVHFEKVSLAAEMLLSQCVL